MARRNPGSILLHKVGEQLKKLVAVKGWKRQAGRRLLEAGNVAVRAEEANTVVRTTESLHALKALCGNNNKNKHMTSKRLQFGKTEKQKQTQYMREKQRHRGANTHLKAIVENKGTWRHVEIAVRNNLRRLPAFIFVPVALLVESSSK